eukprot:9517355-Alexandrium_andersonii.AAC.1
MSASLVGSEMCIRDSAILPGAPWRSAPGLSRNPLNLRQIMLMSPQLIPVSYTHLTLPTICSV